MIPRGFFYKYMFLFLICFLKGKFLLWVFIFYIATAFYYNSNDGTVLVSFMAILFFLFGIKFYLESHLQIAINNPQFKLNQIQKKPFEIV